MPIYYVIKHDRVIEVEGDDDPLYGIVLRTDRLSGQGFPVYQTLGENIWGNRGDAFRALITDARTSLYQARLKYESIMKYFWEEHGFKEHPEMDVLRTLKDQY